MDSEKGSLKVKSPLNSLEIVGCEKVFFFFTLGLKTKRKMEPTKV